MVSFICAAYFEAAPRGSQIDRAVGFIYWISGKPILQMRFIKSRSALRRLL